MTGEGRGERGERGRAGRAGGNGGEQGGAGGRRKGGDRRDEISAVCRRRWRVWRRK